MPKPISSPIVSSVSHAPAASPRSSSTFAEALRSAVGSMAESERAMERGLRAARRGKDLDAGQLLALQAGVYRYSQELELASKLVDKTTGAIKQVLTSQQ